jgi:hypothetical protein
VNYFETIVPELRAESVGLPEDEPVRELVAELSFEFSE